jgi:hypothetical protein
LSKFIFLDCACSKLIGFRSTSTPESLGLKHLAFRPKKQQLIDDNRQRIAKDNAKMMENMAKVVLYLR